MELTDNKMDKLVGIRQHYFAISTVPNTEDVYNCVAVSYYLEEKSCFQNFKIKKKAAA